MNIMIQLEFELAYYEVAVWHISHYTIGIPLLNLATLQISLDTGISILQKDLIFGIYFKLNLTIDYI